MRAAGIDVLHEWTDREVDSMRLGYADEVDEALSW